MGGIDIETIDRQFTAFRERLDEIKGTAAGETDVSPEIVEATLAELDLAEEELHVCIEEINNHRDDGGRDGERRLLTKLFAELPAAVFVLDPQGSIRRSNQAAAHLLGVSHKYLWRRPLAGLIDLTDRAAFRTTFSDVVRRGATATVPVRLVDHRGGRRLEITLRGFAVVHEDRRAVIGLAREAPRPAPAIAGGTTLLLTSYAAMARTMAETAARADRELAEARAKIDELGKALDSRSVIGQAIGILMARRGLTADRGFEALARASQNHNVKLARLAELLVADPDLARRI